MLQQAAPAFDGLVGADEQRQRNFKAERHSRGANGQDGIRRGRR
jgi:hypothetical protein